MGPSRRHSANVSQHWQRGALVGALGAGLGLLSFLVSLSIIWPFELVYMREDPVPMILFVQYGLLGGFVIGGVLGVLYHSYRVVFPSIVGSALLVAGVGHAWWQTQLWDARVGEGYPNLTQVTLFEHIVLLWPVVLIGLLTLALVERYLSQREADDPSKSLSE